MKLRVGALYRQSDIDFHVELPAGSCNPGGGVAVQRWHLSRVIPNINIVSSLDLIHEPVCFTEALWFFDTEDICDRIDQWAALDSFKILINNDLSLARLRGDNREAILDAADIVAATSEYSQGLLGVFYDDVQLIYDPLDIDMFMPRTKTPDIYSSGHIGISKNVMSIVDIFLSLPAQSGLDKTYIGDTNLWGHNGDSISGFVLGLMKDLKVVCSDISNIPYSMLPGVVGRKWGYVADSWYDFSSFCMMEAMLSGCWIFTGEHLLYDERPGRRFDSCEGAVEQIMIQLEETPPESGIINEEARQFIVDRNGYDVFRSRIMDILGGIYFGY